MPTGDPTAEKGRSSPLEGSQQLLESGDLAVIEWQSLITPGGIATRKSVGSIRPRRSRSSPLEGSQQLADELVSVGLWRSLITPGGIATWATATNNTDRTGRSSPLEGSQQPAPGVDGGSGRTAALRTPGQRVLREPGRAGGHEPGRTRRGNGAGDTRTISRHSFTNKCPEPH